MLRLRSLLLIPLLIAAASGCGGGGNPAAPASISGAVTFKGKPVTGGTVAFYTQAGGAAGTSCGIDSDGTYSISDVPAGELIVVVETDSANPEHKQAGGKDADKRTKMMGERTRLDGTPAAGGPATSASEGKYVKIPEKYSKPKTSPLTYTAKAGRQVYNIEMD